MCVTDITQFVKNYSIWHISDILVWILLLATISIVIADFCSL